MRRNIRNRRVARAQAGPRALIVCEGAKTEPLYFEDFREFCKLSRGRVEIVGIGANPTSIVKFAEKEYNTNKKDGTPFDKVFCVFDKNSHADYDRALVQLKNKANFDAIVSVPCFEYWLLLHYNDSTKPYQKAGNKSACDRVISDLTEHIPHYRKGMRNILSHIIKDMETAITNAKRTLAAAQKVNTDNPSTTVHILINHLQTLARSRR